MHTSCHPTLQHHNSYNRTDNYRQWNAFGSPDDGHKDARNLLRYYWLPINHYLLHLVGLSFTYLSKMHWHSNIKFEQIWLWFNHDEAHRPGWSGRGSGEREIYISFGHKRGNYEDIGCIWEGDIKILLEERRRINVDHINLAPEKRQLTSCFGNKNKSPSGVRLSLQEIMWVAQQLLDTQEFRYGLELSVC